MINTGEYNYYRGNLKKVKLLSPSFSMNYDETGDPPYTTFNFKLLIQYENGELDTCYPHELTPYTKLPVVSEIKVSKKSFEHLLKFTRHPRGEKHTKLSTFYEVRREEFQLNKGSHNSPLCPEFNCLLRNHLVYRNNGWEYQLTSFGEHIYNKFLNTYKNLTNTPR